MQAIYYQQFGDADQLHYGVLPSPVPQPGQVLVKVAGCGLNPIDVKTRAGKGFVAAQLGETFCFVPGYDVSGTLMDSMAGLVPGAPVVGMVNFPLGAGACAEYCAADAGCLVAAPSRIPLADAAGLPLAGLTAWQGLFEHGASNGRGLAGQRLLVLAGAGGVGHIAVQLGVWTGATVGATASVGNHPFLASLGVQHCLDYRDQATLVNSGPWDLILDLVGGDTGLAALDCLAVDGLMLTVPTLTAATLMAAGEAKGLQVAGYTVQPNSVQLQQLVELVDQGVLNLHVSQRFSLNQASAAHRLVEAGHVKGKVILEIP